MADLKISQLTAMGAALAGPDEFAVSDTSAGASKKVTITQLRAFLQEIGMPRVKAVASQHSVSTTACSKVTDLDTTLEIGTYVFDYFLIVRSATITVGPQFNFNFSGTTTKARWWFQYADLSSTLLAAIGTMAHDVGNNSLGFAMAQAEDDMATTAVGNMGPTAATNPVQAANTDIMCKITGLIVVGASGDMQLYHGSETATATSVEVGSSLVVNRTV